MLHTCLSKCDLCSVSCSDDITDQFIFLTEYHRFCNRGKTGFGGSPNTELSPLRRGHI